MSSEELSELEILTLVVSSVVILRTWGVWCRDAILVNPLVVPRRIRIALLVTPVACALVNFVVLVTLSASDVRSDASYIAFYLVVGLAWLGILRLPFAFLGISVRDDVLEHNNRSALVATCGALAGVMLSFAGANVGEGPGIDAVLFCGLLSSLAYLVLWAIVERATRISEAITIERDLGAATRICGFVLGLGFLSGWAVAGVWTSYNQSLLDFAHSLWPALFLSAVIILVQFAWKIGGKQPAGMRVSAVVAFGYVAGASAWLLLL